mmetsp:Transcript_2676/g.7431  ORF Transcript_2676/g.7431 Transcript_2676/m.7431 type:complete len:553 (-) Transcript_2676:1268-2926(-)
MGNVTQKDRGDGGEQRPLIVGKAVPYSADGASPDDWTDAPTDHASSIADEDSKKSLNEQIREFFYPSNCPPQCQLFRRRNLAIPICYLVVGTVQGLFRTFLNVYPIDLGATEAQQTTFSTISSLPAAFKLLYGFVTDNVPILGYRRKPYVFLGWFFSSFVMATLWSVSDLTLTRDQETGKAIAPLNAPSMLLLSLSFFGYGFGMWFADATADALVAEKARDEPLATRGSLQSTCYTLRFFGQMVAAPLSTYFYSHIGPQFIVQCLCVIPCVMFPLTVFLYEERFFLIKSTQDQCKEIWKTVCSRSVWEPMSFVYLFNIFQVSNAAWREFLYTVLGFTASQLNSLLVASYVLLYAGTMSYKYFLLQASWRRIYQACILLNSFLSLLQLMLIRGKTLGLSPFLFALGDDAFAEFLSGVQFLPLGIMMMALCPPGSEGASYAMFSTVWNSAMMLAPAISSLLLGIWDVSRDAMLQGNFDGLFNLTLLTTALNAAPIFIIGWLPHGREDMEALDHKAGSGSAIGGGFFLLVLFASMFWTLAVAMMNILHPGWAGGS